MSGPDWVYTETVKDHFVNPRNILEDEKDYNPDGRGIVGSMACGDEMLVVIKVKDDIITDCRWKTYGCASAIASTSMMSVFVQGMTLAEGYKITPADITDQLGGLPNHKFHCSVLGDRALRAAIDDYLEKQGRENPFKGNTATIICECKDVSDQDIEDQVKRGITSYEELQEKTEIGTVCGKCRDKTLELLHEYTHLYGGASSQE
jgi:NifU-like protein